MIVNGNILTMDSKNPRAEALAVKDGKITKVGGDEDIKLTCSKKTSVWDADRKTVIPSFIDEHQHLSLSAESYLQEDCGPQWANSIDDIKK